MKNLLIFIFILGLVGCVSSPVEEFKTIKKGMDKSDVLEIMGNPKTTYHKNGHDVWVYTFYKDDIKTRKILRFKKGQVVYKGKDKKFSLSNDTGSGEDKEFKEYKKSLKKKRREKGFKELDD